MMTRDQKLIALTDVILSAAAKAKEMSDAGTEDGYLSRETALPMQIEGIAHEFKALAASRADQPPA